MWHQLRDTLPPEAVLIADFRVTDEAVVGDPQVVRQMGGDAVARQLGI